MSHLDDLDTVIASLRLKLAAAEEQKRREAEFNAQKTATPMKTLETNLNQSRQSIEYHSKHKRWAEASYARQRVVDFEPILEMLKQIQTRLDVLEEREATRSR
jgi:hypothetical protein